MIKTSCPHCNARIKALDRVNGQRVKCPSCQSFFQVSPAQSAIIVRPPQVIEIPEIVEDYSLLAHVPREVVKHSKDCPFCGEEILETAKKCKHCNEIIDVVLRQNQHVEKRGPRETPQPIYINNTNTAVAAASAKNTLGGCFGTVLGLVFTFLVCAGVFSSIVKSVNDNKPATQLKK